ncbi:putative translation initiation factor IF-2 [Frankliniella fusca]|uniref:Translation initiation factor IF-2 n=1 Tax=Frankliniella fusca TaxID=407009 RepID=A0AAE1LBK5_9NEOP|nr:putative translation initiation factor IF-2 [Frankliniella fusca]
MKPRSLVLLVVGLVLLAAGCGRAALIEPRPVDNRRDPHDGEPFEWEPVDDDPWPGPSFTFPAGLPGIDEVDALSLSGARPATLAETRVRAGLLMQLLRAVFNNNNGGGGGGGDGNTKPVSSNEVPGRSWQQQASSGGGGHEDWGDWTGSSCQRLDKRGDRNRRLAN